MNAMRMEKMFKGASELTNEVTLPEAGVMRFVRLDKPGGIGEEATRRSANRPDRPWQYAYLEVDAGDADCLGGEADSLHRRTHRHEVLRRPRAERGRIARIRLRQAGACGARRRAGGGACEARPARVLAEARHDPGNLRPRA